MPSETARSLGLHKHVLLGKGMQKLYELPLSPEAAVLESVMAAIDHDAIGCAHALSVAPATCRSRGPYYRSPMSAFSPISRRVRHAQRYLRVLEVLARHGFADLAQQVGLDRLVDRGREVLGGQASHEHLPRPERVRKVLEELGPTYIKLGQVLSTRPDLIPPEWATEFEKLQNDVPGVDFEIIQKTIETEFPGATKRIFRSIQKKPLAAASMAQVHRARLHDGARIVLKVLRPGIRQAIETDMEILRTLAESAEAHFSNLGYSPTEVVSEFAKELAKETDLTHEARATERLRNFFVDDPGIVFPKVYWEATTMNILAVEEVRGTVLSNLKDDQLDQEERRQLVENGARAVFRQCLEFGFFHADPHPGNLIALPGGRMAFIDCGMTGQIDSRTASQLADLVSGVVTSDLDRVIGVVGALGDVGPEKLEDRALRADVQAIVSQFQDVPLERLNLGKLLQDFFGALRKNHIRCPADLVFLIKALTTIESVGRRLDPSFQMVEFARPYIEALVQKKYSVSAVNSRVKRGFLRYLELAEDLPKEALSILSMVRRNRLSVNVEHRGLDRLTRTVEHASRNISFAMIIAATVVGSAILIHAARNPGMSGLTAIGIAGFVAAAFLAILMVITNRRFSQR